MLLRLPVGIDYARTWFLRADQRHSRKNASLDRTSSSVSWKKTWLIPSGIAPQLIRTAALQFQVALMSVKGFKPIRTSGGFSACEGSGRLFDKPSHVRINEGPEYQSCPRDRLP